MVSVSFISSEKYELQMIKKSRYFCHPFICQKTNKEKNRRHFWPETLTTVSSYNLRNHWLRILVSVLSYRSSSKILKNHFWQPNDDIILNDRNFVGTKARLCCTSWGSMVSVSFNSFEKYELQLRKKFDIFPSSFAQSMKKIDIIFGLKCSL